MEVDNEFVITFEKLLNVVNEKRVFSVVYFNAK